MGRFGGGVVVTWDIKVGWSSPQEDFELHLQLGLPKYSPRQVLASEEGQFYATLSKQSRANKFIKRKNNNIDSRSAL